MVKPGVYRQLAQLAQLACFSRENNDIIDILRFDLTLRARNAISMLSYYIVAILTKTALSFKHIYLKQLLITFTY